MNTELARHVSKTRLLRNAEGVKDLPKRRLVYLKKNIRKFPRLDESFSESDLLVVPCDGRPDCEGQVIAGQTPFERLNRQPVQ